MTTEMLGARDCSRAFALDDVTIRSDGDGRTVEAYTAMFTPVRAEIRDVDGHYYEENAPTSFTKTIADNGTRFGVFYNHAKTIYGNPDGSLSVPIGVPLEPPVPDGKGVFTVTRYLDNPLADSVLDGIRQKAIRGYSYGGRFIKSVRTRASRGSLPTITRLEIAMHEYGPTVFPAFTEAAIVGMRSVSSFLDEISALDPEDVERLRAMLGLTTPFSEPVGHSGTPEGAAAVEEPAIAPLRSAHQIRLAFQRAIRERGVA